MVDSRVGIYSAKSNESIFVKKADFDSPTVRLVEAVDAVGECLSSLVFRIGWVDELGLIDLIGHSNFKVRILVFFLLIEL